MRIRRKFLQNRHSPLSKQLNSTLAISAIPIWCRFLQNWHRLFPKKIEKINIWKKKVKTKMQSDDYWCLKGAQKRSCRPKDFDKDFKINQRRLLQNWRSPLSKQLNTIYIYERRRWKKKKKKAIWWLLLSQRSQRDEMSFRPKRELRACCFELNELVTKSFKMVGG